MDEGSEEERWLFINDWPIRRYIVLNLAFIIALILFTTIRSTDRSSSIDAFGYLLIPLILFIPGAGVLRIMRLHGNDMGRSAMYSLGLSLLVAMAVGFLLNILHYTGIKDDPLTLLPITISFISALMLITFLAWRRDSGYVSKYSRPSLDPQSMIMIAIAILLPCIVIIGTSIANLTGDREPILYAIILICASPLAVISNRIKNYDLLILTLSLAILLQRIMMTNYIMGYDVFSEYSAAQATNAIGWWDVSNVSGAYSALSIVILAPLISNLTAVEIVEMFKFVYPFIFSFLALGIFKVVQSQLGTKAAFLGVLLLIGYQAYFNLLSQMAKQDIAEIFLVIFLLAITEKTFSLRSRRAIIFLSVVGVIISHYAIAYLTIGLLGGLIFLNLITALWASFHAHEGLSGKIRGSMKDWWGRQKRSDVMNVQILVMYLAIFFAWYYFTASGTQLGFVKGAGGYLSTGSAGTTLSQLDALEFLFIYYGTPLHNVEKYIILLSQILSIAGLIYVIINQKKLFGDKINKDFLMLGVLASMLLIACYTVPKLSAMLYYGRFFHFTSIFLCGFLLLGFTGFIKKISELSGKEIDINGKRMSKVVLGSATAFVIIFFLFNTSVIYTFANEYNNSYSLDESVSWSIYSDTDIEGAKWVSMDAHRGNNVINADLHRFPIFIGETTPTKKLYYQWGNTTSGNIIYLSDWNMKYNYAYPINAGGTQTYTPLDEILEQVNGTYDVVYSTGDGTTVIYVPPSHANTNPPGPVIYTYESGPIAILGALAIAIISLLSVTYILRWRRDRDKGV